MKKRRFLLALGLTISALTLASCGVNQDSGVTGNGNNQPSNQEGTQGQGATASQGQPSQSQGASQTQAEPVVLGNINIHRAAFLPSRCRHPVRPLCSQAESRHR